MNNWIFPDYDFIRRQLMNNKSFIGSSLSIIDVRNFLKTKCQKYEYIIWERKKDYREYQYTFFVSYLKENHEEHCEVIYNGNVLYINNWNTLTQPDFKSVDDVIKYIISECVSCTYVKRPFTLYLPPNYPYYRDVNYIYVERKKLLKCFNRYSNPCKMSECDRSCKTPSLFSLSTFVVYNYYINNFQLLSTLLPNKLLKHVCESRN